MRGKEPPGVLRLFIVLKLFLGVYSYAVEQLTWLVAQSTGTASASYLAQLQQRIEQCDRAGGKNADLPKDEDTASFSDIVAAASSAADVTDCLRALAS